jgi:hypothetical protein
MKRCAEEHRSIARHFVQAAELLLTPAKYNADKHFFAQRKTTVKLALSCHAPEFASSAPTISLRL